MALHLLTMLNFEKWFDFQSKALLSNSTIIREICYIREMYVDCSVFAAAQCQEDANPSIRWLVYSQKPSRGVELMNSFSFVLAGDF